MRLPDKYSYVKQVDYESVAGTDWPSFDQFRLHENVKQFVYDEIDQMLAPDEVFDDPAFCVMPFYGWQTDIKSSCCLLPKNHNIEKIRTDMLNSRRPEECWKCWKNEDAGIKSDRQIKNETLGVLEDVPIQSLKEDCDQGRFVISMLKVVTNNTCNATCVTCNSDISSSWGILERKNNIKPPKSWKIKLQDFTYQLDHSRLQVAAFQGGEPFLSSTNFNLLDEILNHGNDDCFVSFVTNGSFDLTKSQKNTLSKFKQVNFCFSIDGVGPVFEYMRYPLSWPKILDNIKWAQDHGIDVSVSYTISNLNLWYHAQTTAWFQEQGINFLTALVEYPSYFQPSALPENIKDRIITDNPDVAKLLDSHTEHDDRNYQQFLVEIQKQDSWKGISIRDYLPEFAEHLPLDQ
jgi:sulfatase maturation enzyme AslB (radical SAM superfamily)